MEFYKILGFIIYYEKYPINNEENERKEKKKEISDQENKIQNDIHDTENTNNQTNKNNIDQNMNFAGKQTASNTKTENTRNTKKKKKTFGDICCQVIFPCYDNCKKENEDSKYFCATSKLGFRKCYYKTTKTEFEPICHHLCCKCEECCGCCKCCQCCECCKESQLRESYTDEEIFCYVYQVQRKCSWFCDLFFRNNILSLIIHNISVEYGIVGFEKKVNENLEIKGLFDDFITIVIYLGFFSLFTLVFTGGCVHISKDKNYAYFSWLSIIFHIFNIIISGNSYFADEKTKNIFNSIFILLPLSYAKFLNFVVMDTLLTILDENNIDILSNSFVLTSVFFIYDIIVFVVIDFFDINSDTLILIQLISAIIIIICHLFSMSKSMINDCKNCCGHKDENQMVIKSSDEK